MKSTLNSITVSLNDAWQKASASLQRHQETLALVEALQAGRFSFAREPWHSAGGEIGNEFLLRSWKADKTSINRGKAFSAIANDGSFHALGSFLVMATLAKTQAGHNETLSINILPSVARDPHFWEALDRSLNGHKPENIIFEILEYEEDCAADHALMQDALEKGYRFALDDFAAADVDWQRLAAFAPYLSFVKLDGPLVRAGFKGKPILAETIGLLQEKYPGLKIIAEYVRTSKEAQALYNMGVTAVQGQNMPQSIHSTARHDM